jgi:molybdopterin-binding protein
VSEVDVQTPAGIVTSVVTTRSLRDLGLQIGSEVIAVVKATDAALATV